ncbi:autotransporter outer membrane beta-barrel domain-containing protein, partial [Helicobacter pametensis]
GNIAVATVKDNSGVNVQAVDTVLGFDVARVTLTEEKTTKAGAINGGTGNGYTTYFVGSARSMGILEADQVVMASAVTLNLDLYLANFNSLNKRMGELRDNANAHGVWARVFNGAQSNDFGLGTKSNYTTVQAGYDYAFGFEGANNYVGFALSYAYSHSLSLNQATSQINGETVARKLNDISSNGVELAIYSSYVQDSGWYNDSIAKFSYIMSSFSVEDSKNNLVRSNNKTDNFALTLSDEFGYRFKLGSDDEWNIDPQVEVGLGYFNQSDFKQVLKNTSQYAHVYLDGIADAVFNLRSRVGASFGYDFKQFIDHQDIKASLYMGAFYEYDYLSGGDVKLTSNQGTTDTRSSDLSSDHRFVLNIGTNIQAHENVRVYFDFERSFGGKINTDYQVNLGARYSFGENTGYTPVSETSSARGSAPLKLKEDENTENNTQESQDMTQTQGEIQGTTQGIQAQ